MDTIFNIEQLLPFVAMRPEFAVRQRDGFQLIDYDYVTQTTFDIPELRECRGIKFCPQGLILARPFKKFFNYGERGSDLPLHRPHHVTRKMDGSMIHGILLERRLFLHSRGGHTDVAKKAELFMLNSPQHRYNDLCRSQLINGWTPIFEFTAPHNRIVLRYENEGLTLIGVRHTISGRLLSYKGLTEMGNAYDVPVVESMGPITKAVGEIAFIAHTRALKDEEGYVVHFDDGFQVKVKADEYVAFHRKLDEIGSKRRVVAICCDGLDDVLPLLAPLDGMELDEFNMLFQEQVEQEMAKVGRLLATHLTYKMTTEDSDRSVRKRFAMWMHHINAPTHLRSAAFCSLDKRSARNSLFKHYMRNPDHVRAQWRGQ